MRPSFHPRLINDPFSDPGLFIPFAFQKRALLFDLGDLKNLSPRDLLKISHIFVTHTHMDHFIGFDHILRICLGREKDLHIFGPPDFSKRIEGKLAGYTWNLVDGYDTDFRLIVTEVHPKKCILRIYACRDHFKPSEPEIITEFDGILLQEPAFQIKAELFDHKIPVLGFSLIEPFHININKEALKDLGLPVGSWINKFKKALYRNQNPLDIFYVPAASSESDQPEKSFSLKELTEKIAHFSPGIKITYLTDIAANSKNLKKAIDLAKESDLLFIEAAFLDRDMDVAQKKFHLTAKQAGEIAKKAGVKQLIPFHFSPRYSHDPEYLEEEARRAMKNG